MKPNPVVHFEMPAQDRARVCKFYTEVFGWQMSQLGEEMGHYLLATTTESDQNGPKSKGSINGGFFQKEDNELNRSPHVVIAVDNLEESIEKVKSGKGKIMGPQMIIPGVGKYVSIKDTEGNVVGMLQPEMR